MVIDMRKWFWWAPMPWERDGGAVVTYYQLKKMNELAPRDEHWAMPKVPEELDGSFLPWINFLPSENPRESISSYMLSYGIPLITTFHIGRSDLENIIGPVHAVGGTIVLWQTVHWPDDDIFKSGRLHEIDKIVAPTKYAKDTFQRVAKISPEKIEILPHAVDPYRYYRHPTILERQWRIDRAKQKVILYSGRLSYWKGVHQIIPIMKQLIKGFNCVFIIRGGAFHGIEKSEKLAYIFERLSTNNPNIIFIPDWQPPDFMEELYAMTDILISNSAHEGFNVPLIEIQAVGGVPVTTATPNHVEILGRTGYIGMLLDPRYPVGEVNDGRQLFVAGADQLYGATKWLLENPDEARIMGRRGVENVVNRFNLNTVTVGWLDLYNSLLSDKSMEETMQERIMYE